MAFSLKKRVQSKLNIASSVDDDANALGEVLNRSAKTSKSKKKKKKIDDPTPLEANNAHDSDLDVAPSNSTDGREIIYRTKCPCESHYSKLLLERDYAVTVDQLFDLIFGSNEFVETFRKAQRFYDESITDWTMNEETRCRERILNYKVPYESALVGKGTVITREKQSVLHESSGSHYVLEAEVSNEGVKFSDTFTLSIRYCLVQTSVTTTHAYVTARIQFTKSVHSLFKQVIERNAFSASEEGLKDLSNRLKLVSDFKIEKRRISREGTLRVPPSDFDRSRRMSRHDALGVKSASFPSLTMEQEKPVDSPTHTIVQQSDKLMLVFIIIVFSLLMLYLYLYMKLKHMDALVDNLSQMIKMASSVSSSKCKS